MDYAALSNPLNDIPLAPVPEKGAVPNCRIKDPDTLRGIYTRLRKADDISSKNRALVQGMFDGDPPYSDAELRRAGREGDTNLNFGEAEAQLEYALAGYLDMLNSVETLVATPTTYGAEADRPEWEAIMAEEITRTYRDRWTQFDFNVKHLCHHHIAHGMGIAYWPDATDWRFRGAGLDDFKLPRQTLVTEDDLEVATALRNIPVWHLYQKISNPEVAGELGWDVEAVRKALCKATADDLHFDDWMKLEAEFKNNDLGFTAKQAEVKLVHGWVREFDDTITHLITTESDCGTTEFLYKKRCAFRSMQQVLVLFPYGLGTNALTHGIRGIGHKIFPMVNASNRLRSNAMDAARLASSLIVKPGSEDSLNDLALTTLGGSTMLNPDFSIENPTFPNLGNVLVPVLADMENLLRNRVSGYSTQNVFGGGERKTRFEVAAQLEQAAKLSNSAIELFYGPLQRVFRESIRRMIAKNYNRSEPGGKEVTELRTRILKRGVPLEAFYGIDVNSIRVVRAIGAGSAAARSLALDQLEGLASAYDDVGQHNLRRDRTISIVGVAQADRYIPKIPGQRPPIDTKIAELENAQLLDGVEITIMPNENHLVHVEVHLGKLSDLYAAINAGEVPLEEGALRMLPLFNHASEQLALVSGDPVTTARASMFRQALQQIGEVVTNGVKKADAQARKAQEQAAAESAEAQAGPQEQQWDLDDRIKFEKHMAFLAQREETHRQNMRIKDENAQLTRQLADIKAAETAKQQLLR